MYQSKSAFKEWILETFDSFPSRALNCLCICQFIWNVFIAAWSHSIMRLCTHAGLRHCWHWGYQSAESSPSRSFSSTVDLRIITALSVDLHFLVCVSSECFGRAFWVWFFSPLKTAWRGWMFWIMLHSKAVLVITFLTPAKWDHCWLQSFFLAVRLKRQNTSWWKEQRGIEKLTRYGISEQLLGNIIWFCIQRTLPDWVIVPKNPLLMFF